MMNLKNIFDFNEIGEKLAKAKPLGIAGVCFVAVFIAGFGVGKSGGSPGAAPAKRSLINYTTKAGTPTKAGEGAVKTTTSPPPTSDCPVKGSKSKIYHVQGGSFYERTNAAQCFNTEEEAIAAGYTKSSR